MKKIFNIFAVLLLFTLLCGCPYESPYPIDKPKLKTPPALLGNWRSADKKAVYGLTRLDDYNFKVVVNEDGADKDTYKGYTSSIDNITFVNLNKEGTTTYLLFKIEFKDDKTLALSPVTEYIREKFNSSYELKAFVAANMSNSYFYGETGILSKE